MLETLKIVQLQCQECALPVRVGKMPKLIWTEKEILLPWLMDLTLECHGKLPRPNEVMLIFKCM